MFAKGHVQGVAAVERTPVGPTNMREHKALSWVWGSDPGARATVPGAGRLTAGLSSRGWDGGVRKPRLPPGQAQPRATVANHDDRQGRQLQGFICPRATEGVMGRDGMGVTSLRTAGSFLPQ